MQAPYAVHKGCYAVHKKQPLMHIMQALLHIMQAPMQALKPGTSPYARPRGYARPLWRAQAKQDPGPVEHKTSPYAVHRLCKTPGRKGPLNPAQGP